MFNLNDKQVETDSGPERLVDLSIYRSEIDVRVFFRNLEENLICSIRAADAVFAAVAWLTNDNILDALAELENVSIIVQKEDFLRPDIGTGSDSKNNLQEKYNRLKCNLARYEIPNILGSMSTSSDPTMQPVRCVGNHNKDKVPAFPRMHNKFLVFAAVEVVNHEEKITPYAVWTGSFNFTQTAVLSLENALYITNKQIVDAYFREYGQIASISEKLDWTSDWIEPQWRIGT